MEPLGLKEPPEHQTISMMSTPNNLPHFFS